MALPQNGHTCPSCFPTPWILLHFSQNHAPLVRLPRHGLSLSLRLIWAWTSVVVIVFKYEFFALAVLGVFDAISDKECDERCSCSPVAIQDDGLDFHASLASMFWLAMLIDSLTRSMDSWNFAQAPTFPCCLDRL